MENRIPPSSIEAESHLLGAMLQNNQVRTAEQKRVCKNDFYSERHGQIFQAIIEEDPADIITVSENLKRHGTLEKVGGIDYLADLASSVLITQNATHYSNIVREKAKLRMFINAADQVKTLAYSEAVTPVELRGEAMALLDIRDDSTPSGNTTAMLIEGFFDSLEENKQVKGNIPNIGLKCVDRHVKSLQGLIIGAARPSVGKTTFFTQVALHNAFRGFNVLFFSLEMSKISLIEKMIANRANVDSALFKNPAELSADQLKKTAQAAEEIRKLPIVIFDEMFALEEIEAESKAAHSDSKVDLVIIDYLGLIETSKRFSTTNDRISYITRRLKLLSKSLSCPVIVLSQLKRPEGGASREPCLTDLRDSGSIEQDADIVMFLHDPQNNQYREKNLDCMPTKFIIAKNRTGQRDLATTLQYYRTTQRFYEPTYQHVQ